MVTDVVLAMLAAINAGGNGISLPAALIGTGGLSAVGGAVGGAVGAYWRESKTRVEDFSAYKRGVYRDFIEHLDNYPEDGYPEEKEEWRREYNHRLSTVKMSSGPNVWKEVRNSYGNLQTIEGTPAFINDRDARVELETSMREDL